MNNLFNSCSYIKKTIKKLAHSTRQSTTKVNYSKAGCKTQLIQCFPWHESSISGLISGQFENPHSSQKNQNGTSSPYIKEDNVTSPGTLRGGN